MSARPDHAERRRLLRAVREAIGYLTDGGDGEPLPIDDETPVCPTDCSDCGLTLGHLRAIASLLEAEAPRDLSRFSNKDVAAALRESVAFAGAPIRELIESAIERLETP